MRYTIWSFSDRWRYFQYSEIDTDKFDIERNVVRQREIKGKRRNKVKKRLV